MADLLSIEQIAELREAFALFDKDGDGSITAQDLSAVFKSIGQSVSEAHVIALIEAADLDSNGVVDFSEFLSMAAQKVLDGADDQQQLRDIFEEYNYSHTGHITASNLQQIMGSMGYKLSPEEADEMIREADLDGDGKMNFEDFRRAMSQCGR